MNSLPPITFDPSLAYDLGLTYHSFIYMSSGLLYLIMLLIWSGHAQRNYQIARTLPLFTGISILVLTVLFEKVVTAVSIIVIELNVGPFPNLTLFAANLLFLWNVSYIYMIMMMIANGWCIAKAMLSPAEKQVVVLVGAGMMLVEVLLVGDFALYSLILLFAFLFVFRIFYAPVKRVLHFLNLQHQSVTNLGENYRSLGLALAKKIKIMKALATSFFFYLISRIVVNLSRIELDAFYTTCAEEVFELMFITFLLYILRLRKPEEVRLVVLPDGQLALAPQPAVEQTQVNSPSPIIEMSPVCNTMEGKEENFIIIQPCSILNPVIDFATIHGK